MSNQESPGGVSRRALLKSTALGSLALAAGGLTEAVALASAIGLTVLTRNDVGAAVGGVGVAALLRWLGV